MKVTDDLQCFGIKNQAVIKLPLSNALRGVVHALPEPTMLVDAQGKIFAASPAVTDVLAINNEALLGKSLMALVIDESREVAGAFENLRVGAPPVDVCCSISIKPESRAEAVEMRLNHVRLGPESGAPSAIVVRLASRNERQI